jgi:hypothetical protein
METPEPKSLDQSLTTQNGRRTQNGKFVDAIESMKDGQRPEQVHVYEKLVPGIWSFKGAFALIAYDYVKSDGRMVFRFRLTLSDESTVDKGERAIKERTRLIPTEVKKQVWVRDGGRCVICGATDELHFDHDIPYSKGGSSITAQNVKILCARHNLAKSDKIE